MLRRAITIALALLSSTISVVESRSLRAEGTPGDFDFYLLAQSWQPHFCKTGTFPGCDAPEDYWKTHFTIHGLWPEYNNGYYPEYCTFELLNANAMVNTIGMVDLLMYWPNVKERTGSWRYDRFWQHEWKRHGTCSGLSQRQYFESAIALIKSVNGETPAFIQQNVGKTISTNAIRQAYGGSDQVALRCNGGILSEVYTCWSKHPTTHLPIAKQACPPAVIKQQDSCRSALTSIRTFA